MQPREVAPGAHVLVLRDVCSRASCSRLQAFRSVIQLSVQFLLQRGRRSPRPAAARADHAARRSRRFTRTARASIGPWSLISKPPANRAGRGCRGRDRAGHQSRAAASRADPHRHQARAARRTRCGRPIATGVARPRATATAAVEWQQFPGGLEWVGHDGRGFAFDNEGPRHRVYLEAYQLASRLVTSGEYLAFMERWRLCAARALALRRLERRDRPEMGSPAVLGEERRRLLAR